MTEPAYIDIWAKVAASAVLGRGVRIWAFASVHESAVLDEGVSIGEHVYIGSYATLGVGTRVSQGVHITDHMTIGDRVFIGPGVIFTNDRHPRANNPAYERECPIVEDDVSIGAGAVILPGVRLGRGCVVGAGAIVAHDVPPETTVVGGPARLLYKRAPDAEWAEVRSLYGQ